MTVIRCALLFLLTGITGNLATSNLATSNLAVRPSPLPTATVGEIGEAFALLKDLEAFAAAAYWDVNAYRNGYGTRAKYKGEVITKADAGARAREQFDAYLLSVRKINRALTDRQAGALASVMYNVGSFGPDLRAAIVGGDPGEIARMMALYIKVDGKPHQGVKARRAKEIAFFLGA